MADKPILLPKQMVLALHAGEKTQTRQAIKLPAWATSLYYDAFHSWRFNSADHFEPLRLPIEVGDRLWVREAHQIYDTHGQHRGDGKRWGPWAYLPTTINPDGTKIAYYRAGFDRSPPDRWRPSTHMPRWASRVTLTVTKVRVERLQDISEADALAEGIDRLHWPERGDWGWPQRKYREAWETINGTGSWDANPWVAAYTFTVQLGNIDRVKP